jgi:hypothetical protein
LEIGGMVVLRDGGAVVTRTGGGTFGSWCCDVPLGARPRGSGWTSPAPRIGGMVEVMRAGCGFLVVVGRAGGREGDFGGWNSRSSDALGVAGAAVFTDWMSALIAVDSVFAMKLSPETPGEELRTSLAV